MWAIVQALTSLRYGCGCLFIVLPFSKDGEGGSFLSMVSFAPVGPFYSLFLTELLVCRAEPLGDMGPTATEDRFLSHVYFYSLFHLSVMSVSTPASV